MEEAQQESVRMRALGYRRRSETGPEGGGAWWINETTVELLADRLRISEREDATANRRITTEEIPLEDVAAVKLKAPGKLLKTGTMRIKRKKRKLLGLLSSVVSVQFRDDHEQEFARLADEVNRGHRRTS